MTRKLFWEDPYLTTCDAVILYIDGKDVVLDQSVLFAFSGGQQTDAGTIGGIGVADAQDGEDIVYTLASEPAFAVGDAVQVKIDAHKRALVRRLHSAAHVVWWLFREKTGKENLVGSNVTSSKARLDYEMEESVGPILPELEAKANEIFSRGEPITFKVEDGRRIWCWNNSGVEICVPCSGTHVRSLKEIGSIQLKRKNIGKGKERLEVTLLRVA